MEWSSIYVEDSIPLHGLHMFLVALSILRAVSKYTVSRDWYVFPVDLVANLCAQCRTDRLLEWHPAKSWMHFMSHALNTFGYCLAIMRSNLVGYFIVGSGYNLVSCTLSETQS